MWRPNLLTSNTPTLRTQKHLYNIYTTSPNVFAVDPALYKCSINVLFTGYHFSKVWWNNYRSAWRIINYKLYRCIPHQNNGHLSIHKISKIRSKQPDEHGFFSTLKYLRWSNLHVKAISRTVPTVGLSIDTKYIFLDEVLWAVKHWTEKLVTWIITLGYIDTDTLCNTTEQKSSFLLRIYFWKFSVNFFYYTVHFCHCT